MNSKNEVVNIKAADYNGARTVYPFIAKIMAKGEQIFRK